jgi:hypothetical protein
VTRSGSATLTAAGAGFRATDRDALRAGRRRHGRARVRSPPRRPVPDPVDRRLRRGVDSHRRPRSRRGPRRPGRHPPRGAGPGRRQLHPRDRSRPDLRGRLPPGAEVD